MGLHQAIIAEIDREFTDSLGNWTGDAVWEATGPGFLGCAALVLAPGESEKTMSLAYPYIKVRPGLQHRLGLSANLEIPGITIALRWELTDGIYTFSGETEITWDPTPTDIDEYIDLTDDFDREAVNLSITAFEDTHAEEIALFTDWYSLTYETAKIQYLPLMGVG